MFSLINILCLDGKREFKVEENIINGYLLIHDRSLILYQNKKKLSEY